MAKCKLLLLFLLFATQVAARPIIIGSKAFSESIIISEMLAQVLEEKYSLKITRKLNLGGTKIVHDSLNNNHIDIYSEYTGTGYVMILGMSGESHPDKVFDIVEKNYSDKFSIYWSGPLGFNNTYAIAVKKDDPRFKNISKTSELASIAPQLRLGAPHEFMERQDGFASYKEAYGLNFDMDKVSAANAGLLYSAIADNSVDLIMVYSTDGRIKAFDLKIIEDDKNFFPPYQAAFLAKQKLLKEFPQIKKAFALFADNISESEMVDLNYQVDKEKKVPAVVAKNFLIQKGILGGEKIEHQKSESFWQYVVLKKDYLLKVTKEHILLTIISLFLAILISLPLGVAMSRYEKLASAVFPIINTFQTIPSLALLGFLIPIMGIGFAPAIFALFIYSLLPLVRNTYTGIKGVNPLFIEASRGIGLTNLQILTKVEIPLAMPIILAGIRTASVIVVGTATLAALVGAGGLGDPIFRGVATVNSKLILLGAIPSAILAIFIDKLLGKLEKTLVSKGLRLKRQN